MQMLFWRNNIEDRNCPSPGLSLISYVNPIEKYLVFEPRSGSKFQLYSQSKLTTLRRENRKIRQENEILKAKEPAPYA
jgi:transposase-like protein